MISTYDFALRWVCEIFSALDLRTGIH